MIAIHNYDLIPKKGSTGATCFDLFCREGVTIEPGEVKLVPTGIKTDFASKIYARSSLAIKRKLMLANSVAIIDEDYRGEIMIALYNFGSEPQSIAQFERVAQIEMSSDHIMTIDREQYNNWEQLTPTERGGGGFGSTGNKEIETSTGNILNEYYNN